VLRKPRAFVFIFDSGSSCSLAAGLESLGLTDIRTLVRLMCLAAAGRAGLSTSPSTISSSTERARGIHSKTSKPISCLAYLSTAVGCLASNTPSAAKLLVQLCTQVGPLFQCECLYQATFTRDKAIHFVPIDNFCFYLLNCDETVPSLRISLESLLMTLHKGMFYCW